MSFEEVEGEFQEQARRLGLTLEIRKEDLGEELYKERENMLRNTEKRRAGREKK